MPAQPNTTKDDDSAAAQQASSQLSSVVTGQALWLVDGFNVLHACLLRGRDRAEWWSEARQAEVVTWLQDFARSHLVAVVFDAKGRDSTHCSPKAGRCTVCFASDADEYIIEQVRQTRSVFSPYVVTADRSLADRAKHHGAQVLKPWAFRALVEPLPRDQPDAATPTKDPHRAP